MYDQIFESIDFERVVDHPNILIAAHFWDTERYQAARNCYKFMRAIDDLIDNYKTEHITIAPENQAKFEADVYRWISTVIEASSEMPSPATDRHRAALLHPVLAARSLPKSMIYDIYHDGFPTLQGFIDYAGGASVAPASIFVHLAGLRQSPINTFRRCSHVKEVATPLSYIQLPVHIIRDFQKDHLNNLNYFPDDLIAKHGIIRQQLLFMAKGGQITDGFRSMIRELYEVADVYRERTLEMIRQIKPLVEPRSQLSLESFSIYTGWFLSASTLNTAPLPPPNSTQPGGK